MQPLRPRSMRIGGLILLAASSCHAGTRKEAVVNETGQNMRAPTGAPADATAPIGVATQEPDGTIVLQLRAEGADGATGDAQFRYPPAHKDYQMIVRHVGPIPKGGSVPVKPFARQ